MSYYIPINLQETPNPQAPSGKPLQITLSSLLLASGKLKKETNNIYFQLSFLVKRCFMWKPLAQTNWAFFIKLQGYWAKLSHHS